MSPVTHSKEKVHCKKESVTWCAMMKIPSYMCENVTCQSSCDEKVWAQIDARKSHFAVSSAQFDEIFAKFKKFDENSSQFDENIAKFIKFADFARNCDELTPKCDEMFSITDWVTCNIFAHITTQGNNPSSKQALSKIKASSIQAFV